MPRSPVLATALLLAAALLAGCSGGDPAGDPAPTSSPPGHVEVRTDLGSVSRPAEWEPHPAGVVQDVVASFAIPDEEGAVVGQLDVIVNEVPPGSDAEAVNAATQGARALNFRDLRHVRRESVEVPGAETAFVNESTYTAPEGSARSVDQLAISESGALMLVRVSALESAWDEDTVAAVLTTMRLTQDDAS